MRRHQLASIVLATAMLAGCAQTGFLVPGAPGAGEFEALGRKALGGEVYASFKIAPDLPKADGARKAVKLTYLMTDDTAHQSPQSQGMLQMMDDLPQRHVHNVIFRDGGEMGDSRLYYLQRGDNSPKTVRNPQSPLAPGVSEVQSNNPRVFSQVLGWTLDQYPGKRKYLQIYTHGGGLFGIGTDSHQTAPTGKSLAKAEEVPIMRMPAFSEALRQGLKGRKLDLIYFRACLMGSLEALYELRGTTRYALASEDVSYSVDNSNLAMTRALDEMANDDMEPAAIAKALAVMAHAKNPKRKDGSFSGYTTFAAIDIERLDELKTAVNGLSKALIAAMPTHREAILAAYDAVPTVQGSAEAGKHDQGEMRDLWAFTAELDRRVTDRGVQTALDRTRRAQEAAMLHSKDTFGSAANGLSIFMPARKAFGDRDGALLKFLKGHYQTTRFGKDSNWDDFLELISAGGGNR